MTTNTNQPNPGNRDDASRNTGAGVSNQGQPARSGQEHGAKASASTQRDEGTRNFGSATEPTVGAARDGGNAAAMRYLDAITENLGKLRTAIGAASRDGSNRTDERKSDDRRPSTDDAAVREPNRDPKATL